jgi:hypothetical protein
MLAHLGTECVNQEQERNVCPFDCAPIIEIEVMVEMGIDAC